MRKYVVLGVVVGVVAVLVYLGVRGQQSKSSGPVFRIGVLSWVGFGPFYIAQEAGLFEKEGLNVEIVKIEDDAPLREALTSKRVQGIIGTVDSFAISLSAGLPAKVVLKVDESCGSDGIVARDDIKSLKDLKGKRVAFPKGVPSHFFLLYLLKENGLTSKDIIVENMEAGEAAAAFMAGKVDAAVTWEPWLSKAKATEHAHVLVTSADYPGLIGDLFAVHSDVLKTRPEDVRRFLRAWFAALQFVEQNPAKAHEIIGRNMGCKIDEVGPMLGGLRFATHKDNLEYFRGQGTTAGKFTELIGAAGQIWEKEGSIKKAVPGKDAYDAIPLSGLYN